MSSSALSSQPSLPTALAPVHFDIDSLAGPDPHYLLKILPRSGPRAFPPPQSVFTAQFWQGLTQGLFLASQCEDCGRMSFPPKPFCPHCWHPRVRWRPLRPQGRLYSMTVVHAAPQVFKRESPYHVGIIDLVEGLRIATRLLDLSLDVPLDAPAGLTVIGQAVELVVLRYDDGPLFAARVLNNENRDKP